MIKGWVSSGQRGFTIVELLIVIVVIAILATISIVAFNGINARANDSKTRSAVHQFEVALQTWVQDYPPPIKGGSGSTVAASNGTCADGSSGFVGTGLYMCTVEDALVSAGQLPAGFTSKMPKNTYFGGSSGGQRSMMIYGCGGTKYALYWTLQNPSSDDLASVDATISSCGNSTSIKNTWGMRAGKVVQL